MYMDKSVLSMKDKQIPIVISLLDKGEKGTNLALQFGISRLNESYIIIISSCSAIGRIRHPQSCTKAMGTLKLALRLHRLENMCSQMPRCLEI